MITFSYMRRRPFLRSLLSRPVTEQLEAPPGETSRSPFSGSLQLRHVDVGSCNGCELEIASAFGPHFDAARFGVRLVASPRHSDGLLVTGVVTKNMAGPLFKTLEATPNPRIVIACGDCAVNGGIFAGAYGIEADLDALVDVDFRIPGCPPDPSAITQALRGITGR
jgi:Ni,Fe-hydrogenase III small subunit